MAGVVNLAITKKLGLCVHLLLAVTFHTNASTLFPYGGILMRNRTNKLRN
jgi:hypothetical protein